MTDAKKLGGKLLICSPSTVLLALESLSPSVSVASTNAALTAFSTCFNTFIFHCLANETFSVKSLALLKRMRAVHCDRKRLAARGLVTVKRWTLNSQAVGFPWGGVWLIWMPRISSRRISQTCTNMKWMMISICMQWDSSPEIQSPLDSDTLRNVHVSL